MARKSLSMVKQMFSRKRKGDFYSGRGEDFKYWERYVSREMDTVRGREVDHLFEGYKRRNKHDWYYDESLPFTSTSKRKQTQFEKMPLVKPLKEWDIFLGDRVEVLVGRDKGKIGEVVEIIKERNWCFVEGLHLEFEDTSRYDNVTHLRGIPRWVGREKPLLVTKEVKLIDPSDLSATDFEWRYTEEGERVRVSVRSGRIIPIPYKHRTTWEDYTKTSDIKPTKKDTLASNVASVTYVPKLCTFEEDIAKSMGIEYNKNKRDRRRSYWY